MSTLETDQDLTAAVLAMYRVSFAAFAELASRLLDENACTEVRWPLRLAALRVEQCLDRAHGRLVVNAPPYAEVLRSVSVALPAWLLGRWPHLHLSCISQSPAAAAVRHAKIRQIIEHPFYGCVFPGVSTHTKHRSIRTSRGGRISTTSVGQPPGGLRGDGGACDALILDTPDALHRTDAPKKLAATVFWYDTVAAPALQNLKDGRVILATPRLHRDDLSSHLLDTPGCAHLSLPSLATGEEQLPLELGGTIVRRRGDALEPDRHPKPSMREVFDSLGAKAFAALHQQKPSGPELREMLPNLSERMESIRERIAFDSLFGNDDT